MKKRFLLALILGVIFANGAFAGPAYIAGVWTGDGEAILPGGEICEIELIEGTVFQDGTLLHGTFDFEVESDSSCVGGEGIPFTGNISAGNRIKAILSVPGIGPLGVLDAKLKGKTISGVLVDFTDGSTSIFNVTSDD